jgi:Uncharacterized conserved protein
MFKDFKWDNESRIIKQEGSTLLLEAHPNKDYFVNPEDGAKTLNAAYYYKMVTGDFVLRAKVTHEFTSTYDACAFLAMQDDTTWGKLCFEKSDFETNAVVSVVTRGVSDDANSVNIDGKTVWLQMVRKGNIFGLHYSVDGEKFYMVRLFKLDCDDTIKVGLVAQSPTGDGGEFLFENITLENRRVENVRAGQ